jgi:multiple sugar transport system substrate-binding protein
LQRTWLLALAFLSVLACSHEDSGEIVFWQFQNPEVMEPLIERFEAANPGIRVRLETLTWQSGYEKIVMAFSSGQVPDLLEVGSTWLPKFVAEGAVEDITDRTEDLKEELMMWELATSSGRRFGVPWLVGSRVLFFNRDLFVRAGLSPDEPPVTWSDMKTASERIHDLGEDVFGFGMNAGERYVLYKKFMPFAWGNGGRILSEDLAACEVASAANLEALEFYLSLKPYSILERQDMIDQMFKQGRVGIMISGGWNLERIPEDAPNLDFGVALIPRPDIDGVHASFAGAEILVVPKSSRGGSRREAALALAEFLVGPGEALAVSREVKGVQPAALSAITDPYYGEHPMERLLVEQCRTSRSAPPSPYWVEIEEVINARLEECLYGRISPREALRLMEADVNTIIR